jgi:hypothetical protein
MKAPLKTRSRPTPEEAVRIATETEPSLPPARLPQTDKQVPFSTRFRTSTLAAIEARAKAEGISLKLVICRALAEAGVAVAPGDLEDGTPRRRSAA